MHLYSLGTIDQIRSDPWHGEEADSRIGLWRWLRILRFVHEAPTSMGGIWLRSLQRSHFCQEQHFQQLVRCAGKSAIRCNYCKRSLRAFSRTLDGNRKAI